SSSAIDALHSVRSQAAQRRLPVAGSRVSEPRGLEHLEPAYLRNVLYQDASRRLREAGDSLLAHATVPRAGRISHRGGWSNPRRVSPSATSTGARAWFRRNG